MKRLKRFFDRVVKSLTKFPYYKEIEKAKFTFSLKYLFFLFYLVSLVGSIIFAVSISALILPKVPVFISQFESKASSLYPAGLVVTIKNGEVSTNEKDPVYVDSLNQFNITKGFEHFLTIDTRANVDSIKDENTAILVTKDSIVTMDNNNSYQVYPIEKGTNMTIDQSSYNKLISQINPYLKYIEPGLITLVILSILVWPFVGAALSLGTELIYLLIISAIFFLVVKAMKKHLTFKKLYQLSMHAATLPILLGFIVAAIGIQMPFLLGSAILFIFMILVLNQFE